MNRTDYLLLITVIVAIAFAAAYHFKPPAPRYYPLEHAWKMENVKGVPSMGWYGRTAWGVGIGAAAGVVAALALLAVPKRADGQARQLPGWAITLLSLAAVVTLVLLAGEILHHEFDKWGTYQTWQIPAATR
jgi:peptidoglycan/LPS O-acetylase OafA/YrhL